MNKKELIKHFEDLPYVSISQMGKKSFIDMIEQLDEPQKVTVPQFIADHIKDSKEVGRDLQDAMNSSTILEEVDLWLYTDNNMDTFARAWLDGYEIEQEKRYYVRLKGVDENYNYLNCIKHLNAWALTEIKTDKKFRTTHTRKELEKANFGWVFDCPGMEVEEVE